MDSYLLRDDRPREPARAWVQLTGERPPPPMDVRGSFSCCAYCAVIHENDRCEGCPRPRTRAPIVVAAPPWPGRRWFRPPKKEAA